MGRKKNYENYEEEEDLHDRGFRDKDDFGYYDSDYANEGGISEWEEDDNPPEPTEKEKEQYKNANENLKRIIEKNNRWFRQEYEYSQEKDTTQKYIDVENSGNRKKKYE